MKAMKKAMKSMKAMKAVTPMKGVKKSTPMKTATVMKAFLRKKRIFRPKTPAKTPLDKMKELHHWLCDLDDDETQECSHFQVCILTYSFCSIHLPTYIDD
jgi:hypothetical protein